MLGFRDHVPHLFRDSQTARNGAERHRELTAVKQDRELDQEDFLKSRLRERAWQHPTFDG